MGVPVPRSEFGKICDECPDPTLCMKPTSVECQRGPWRCTCGAETSRSFMGAYCDRCDDATRLNGEPGPCPTCGTPPDVIERVRRERAMLADARAFSSSVPGNKADTE